LRSEKEARERLEKDVEEIKRINSEIVSKLGSRFSESNRGN
jgi:hypothetical protein